MFKKTRLLAALLLLSMVAAAGCRSDPEQHGTWTTENGATVSPTIIRLQTGAEHCGWQDTWFLSFGDPIGTPFGSVTTGGLQFVQNSEGTIAGSNLESEFDPDAELPGDAQFTGYTWDDAELWISDAELDSAVYMVSESTTEKWPRVKRPILCD